MEDFMFKEKIYRHYSKYISFTVEGFLPDCIFLCQRSLLYIRISMMNYLKFYLEYESKGSLKMIEPTLMKG